MTMSTVTEPAADVERSAHGVGALLGELLIATRRISNDNLADALRLQSGSGKRIGQILVELHAIGEADLARALAEQLDLPFVDLSQIAPTQNAAELLPELVARAQMAVPVSSGDSGLTVAVCEPSLELISVLKEAAKQPVHLVVAPRSDVQRAIDTTYRTLGQIKQYVEAFEATEGPRRPQEVAAGTVQADDAPVVQVVNLILTQALRDRASDIHIEPQGDRLQVRYRIDGSLQFASELPASMAPAIVSRLKIMAGMNIVERRRPQDGQFTMELDGREIDIRVSTVATIWGECCVDAGARQGQVTASHG